MLGRDVALYTVFVHCLPSKWLLVAVLGLFKKVFP